MIEQSQKQGEDAFPDSWKMVPSLKIYAGKAEDGSTERFLQKQLILAWVADRTDIIRLTHKITRKMAIVPNLDGQFGGKPCVRNSDKKKLTIRDSKDQKFDKKTMTNGIPRDQKEFYGVCHLQICPGIQEINDDPGSPEVKCKNVAWTKWAEWGKCSEICGDKGTRKRHRKCVDMCNMKEHKGECESFFDNIQNKNFTDTDWTHCSPCPAHMKSEWSQWGEWERVDPPGCGECVPCGEPGKMLTLARTRVCIANKKGEKKCKKDSGNNSDRQERKIPKTPCESDEGIKYKDGKAENNGQGGANQKQSSDGPGNQADQNDGYENSSEGGANSPDEGGTDGPDVTGGGSDGPNGPDDDGAAGPDDGGADGPDGTDKNGGYEHSSKGGTNDPDGGADGPKDGADGPEGGYNGPNGADEGGADGPGGPKDGPDADGSDGGADGSDGGADGSDGGADGPQDGADGPQGGDNGPKDGADGSDGPEDGPDKN